MLHYIALTAYNVGFGGKKHFVTYDVLRIVPKAVSLLTMIIGVFQLLDQYKTVSTDNQQLISVILLSIGLIAFVVDLSSDPKEEYNVAGKKLLVLFNELRRIYLEVDSLSDSSDFSTYIARIDAITQEVSHISISKQVVMGNWLTHIGFFYVMQSKWVSKELGHTWRDKLPILHFETLIYVSVAFAIVYSILYL